MGVYWHFVRFVFFLHSNECSFLFTFPNLFPDWSSTIPTINQLRTGTPTSNWYTNFELVQVFSHQPSSTTLDSRKIPPEVLAFISDMFCSSKNAKTEQEFGCIRVVEDRFLQNNIWPNGYTLEFEDSPWKATIWKGTYSSNCPLSHTQENLEYPSQYQKGGIFSTG